MSFPFGNRSSFRDRPMGKSGDEIMDDMLKNIKQRKKEFFESPPKWRSMGMFDDELGSAGGSRFKDHLGDLAARHPELADHLLDLLPEEKKSGTIPKEPGKAEVKKNTSQNYNTKEATPQTATIGTQTGGLESDVKLRSTVPDMQSTAGDVTDGDRGQRSQSAPPQAAVPNRPQQKDEGIRQIPVRTDSPSGMPNPGPQMPRQPNHSFQKQPSGHFQQSHQQFYQPQQQHFPEQHGRPEEGGKGPTVRHIPIFVEGRDEPLLPKDIGGGPSAGVKQRGGCQGKTDHQGTAPEKKQSQEQQNHDQGQQQSTHQQAQQQQQQAQSTSTPPPQPQKPDCMSQIAEVVKEVDAYAAKVNEWNGSSRTDKEYIYLDEMLTRNLLKLDNIETEGKDEVRTARKDAIRRVQAAISILESMAERNQRAQNNQQVNEVATLEQMDLGKDKSSLPQHSEPSHQNGSTQTATQT